MTRIGRRQAIAAFGTVGLGTLLAACTGREPTTSADVPTTQGGTASVSPQTGASPDLFAGSPTCTLTPAETEGPYYFDADAIRSDIRENRPGTPLRLALRVQSATACQPIANAVVDIWHCDATGLYSGFESASRGGTGATGGTGGTGGGRTDQETYLRGAQVTNASGIVGFTTIYPGWYRGRTVHIHAKVHLDSTTLLTTQLFFDEAVTSTVYARAPYAAHTGRDQRNATDSIFDERLLLRLSQESDGYLGIMTIGVRGT